VLAGAGEPAYRADQARRWFWQQLAPSFEAMRTLSPPARTALQTSFIHSSVTPHLRRSADAGETVKYLFKLREAARLRR